MFFNNTKVAENYFFMTSLTIINAIISILIYPYVIRTLEKDSYGLYVFALSIVSFLSVLVDFGFHSPAMKMIAQNRDDIKKKNEIVSSVFTAKIIIVGITTLIFSMLCMLIPVFYQNFWLFWIVYSQIFVEILFPKFFFLGMQKMKYVTYIQLIFRLLTIPLILIFIKNNNQLVDYALIMSSAMVSGSVVAAFIMWKIEGIVLRFVPIRSLKNWIQDSFPFFITDIMGVFKQESVTILIGVFFKMSDVAIYDLANKIILMFRYFTSSINSALFPKISINPNKLLIKRIIRYEKFIGMSICAIIIAFGYWFVLLLGGETMMAAYPLAIILSTVILTSLLANSYINFVFVQMNRYYLVARNQLVALITYLLFTAVGLLFLKNIAVVVTAYALSSIVEVFYCKYLTKKYDLL